MPMTIFLLCVITKSILGELPPEQYKRLCYFNNWSQDRDKVAQLMPEQVDPWVCTHLLYSFYFITGTSLKATAKKKNDEDLLKRLKLLREVNPELKIVISVGGANAAANAGFASATNSEKNRQSFVKNVIKFLRDRELDGIDLDWEFPTASQKDQLTQVVAEFRKEIDAEATESGKEKLSLSAAVSAAQRKIDPGYDVAALGRDLDFIGIMTYDLHGAWDRITGFNSPLFARPEEDGIWKTLNTEWAMNHWHQKGAPKEKLLIGLASYGRTWNLGWGKDKGKTAKVGQSANGGGKAGPYLKEGGVLSYYEICEKITKDNAKPVFDTVQQCPYVVADNMFIGYDNTRSWQSKIRWMKKAGYGGVIVWALDLDDFNGTFCDEGPFPLMNIMKETFDEIKTTTQKPTPWWLMPTTTMVPATTESGATTAYFAFYNFPICIFSVLSFAVSNFIFDCFK